jgi:hypothetical protein
LVDVLQQNHDGAEWHVFAGQLLGKLFDFVVKLNDEVLMERRRFRLDIVRKIPLANDGLTTRAEAEQAQNTPANHIRKVIERDAVAFKWEPFRFQRDGVSWKYYTAVELQSTYDSILVSLDPRTRLVTHVYIFQVTVWAERVVNLQVLAQICKIYNYIQWENMSLIFLHPVFGEPAHESVTTPLITGTVDTFSTTLGMMKLYDAEWNVHAALNLASTGNNCPKFGKFMSQQLSKGKQECLLPVKKIKAWKEEEEEPTEVSNEEEEMGQPAENGE